MTRLIVSFFGNVETWSESYFLWNILSYQLTSKITPYVDYFLEFSYAVQ